MEKKEHIKADGILDNDGITNENITYFEYLQAKVDILQEELMLVIQILKQNNLVFKTQESPNVDIEDSVWKRLKT